MSLLFYEGFEFIHGSVDASRRFIDSTTGFPTNLTPFVAGRRPGGRCLRATNGDSFVMRTAALSPGSTTAIIGCALRVIGPSSTTALVRILNSSNAEQLTLTLEDIADVSVLKLKRGATVLHTSSYDVNTWLFVELSATIHATLGAWELRVNEMTIDSGTGNTSNSGTTGYSKLLVSLVSDVGGNYTSIDDLYLLSAAGDAPFNRFLGNIGIESVTPFRLITEGTFPWTPNTGTNKEAVDDGDEGPVDDDTTYVAYSTQGKMDLFSMNPVVSIRSSMLALVSSADITNTGGSTEPFHLVEYLEDKENIGIFAILGSAPYERQMTYGTPVTSEDNSDTLYGYANTLSATAHPVP